MKALHLFFLCTLFWTNKLSAQTEISIIDFKNFQNAYQLLTNATSLADSIEIFQKEYFDKATKENQQFIKLRQFSAKEAIRSIQRYPQFFSSLQKNFSLLDAQVPGINKYVLLLKELLPGFKPPKIIFAYGCLRTGGTVSNNTVLIGTEFLLADSTTITLELTPWLKNSISKQADIIPVVVHEAVHTYQKHKFTKDLSSTAIKEGFADFVTRTLLGLDINHTIHSYGKKHECSLWKRFKSDTENRIADFSEWIYGGSDNAEKPADLGYFTGFKIVEDFYQRNENKRTALVYLSDCRNYNQIYKETKYTGGCEHASQPAQ